MPRTPLRIVLLLMALVVVWALDGWPPAAFDTAPGAAPVGSPTEVSTSEGGSTGAGSTASGSTASGSTDSAALAEAFRDRVSGLMLDTVGRVVKVLPDDREGSRHQRFILRVTDDHTVLVVHNIDLAPRVPLSEGDVVDVRGQYEWNAKGGLIHWTHHDPAGRHAEGFIRHAGRTYR